MTSLIIHDIYHPSRCSLLSPSIILWLITLSIDLYKHQFLVKIAFFEILANFDVVFKCEGVQIEVYRFRKGGS